jgi:hypothetical protein
MSTVVNHPAIDDVHRRAFVKAWEAWCRGTAQQMTEARSFEELTSCMHEMNVCREVLGTLIAASSGEDAS